MTLQMSCGAIHQRKRVTLQMSCAAIHQRKKATLQTSCGAIRQGKKVTLQTSCGAERVNEEAFLNGLPSKYSLPTTVFSLRIHLTEKVAGRKCGEPYTPKNEFYTFYFSR